MILDPHATKAMMIVLIIAFFMLSACFAIGKNWKYAIIAATAITTCAGIIATLLAIAINI